ncbi:MAG: hypothetical protein IT373_10510 [Polyangiaceae bacterium]|nr:hypothetical protein [Polyangiaceae bacterium]
MSSARRGGSFAPFAGRATRTTALALVLTAACGDAKEPAARATASTATGATTSSGIRGSHPFAPDIAWDAPAGWEVIPAEGAFRKAAYRVPRAPGDTADGELTVVVAGGGVGQNIERWKSQFELEPTDPLKVDERQIAGMKLTLVELHGAFKGSGMPGEKTEPRPGWAMLAAVVPTRPQAYFFKLTGPRATVEAAKAGFDALIASLRLP